MIAITALEIGFVVMLVAAMIWAMITDLRKK